MEMFFKDLGVKIQQAIEKDIKNILNEVGEEHIYAAALVTDSDCISLYLALNTYEYMRKKDEKYIEMIPEYLTEQQIKNVREGSESLTKWTPAEWGYSDEKESGLNDISKLLFDKEESNPEAYAEHKDLFFETITSAFKRSIESKIFGDHSEEITYFISMSDDDSAYEIEDYSAELLNTKKVYEDFLKRYD